MEWPWQSSDQRRTVLLIRHGRTLWNAQRRFLGRSDVPLDAVGLAQARALAPLGPAVDRVWSSPLSRARQTAEGLGAEMSLVDDLAELDQGELEGLSGPEALARWPEFFLAFSEDPTDVVVPGGESLGALQARALGVLERVEDGTTALVSHQMVIAALRCAIAGVSLARWRAYRVDNATVTALVQGPDGWEETVAGWVVPGSPPPTV